MKPQTVIVACTGCKTKNRVPAARMKDHPKCGRCGSLLSMENLGKPVVVTDATFHQEVMASALPVLVDCWAPWCGPCRAVGPIMDALAEKYQGRLKVAKLNLDENPATGSRFAISSVPTMLLVKNGKVQDTLVGALPKEQLEAAIGQML
ncbi:MAG TPA: thioredoxin TrxC [Desulfotignum sp.]|nr:thioredoxin TrxC [Desulfotignum sp.]